MARTQAPGRLLSEVRKRAREGWPGGLVVLHGESYSDAFARGLRGRLQTLLDDLSATS